MDGTKDDHGTYRAAWRTNESPEGAGLESARGQKIPDARSCSGPSCLPACHDADHGLRHQQFVLRKFAFRFIAMPLILDFGDKADGTQGSASFATGKEMAPLFRSTTGLLIGRVQTIARVPDPP